MTTNLQLIAQQLMVDPRVDQAKNLLSEALEEHRKKISGVRPPHPSLKDQYHIQLKEFSHLRGNKLYFPYIGSGIGNGALVELLDGSVKYDFITGIGPHCYGHSSLELLETNIDAALGNTIMQGNLQQNGDSLEFCRLLTEASGFDHCFLTTTGVMANENALKIAFHKNYPANRILAFEGCFLGRSLAASQVTDKAAYREGLPLNYHVDYIPFYDEKDPQGSTEKAVSVLNKHLKRFPKQYAVMIMEFIQGEGGFYSGTREFFMALIKILKDHEIAIHADEIQTFGRTSRLFAFQHFGLDAFVDIVTIGKLSQVCATLFRSEFTPGPGLLSQTFTGSTSAIRGGTKIVRTLLSDGYYGSEGKNMHLHKLFVEYLEGIAKRHPCLIEGPYGIGTMIAFTPFKGNPLHVNEFVQKLFEAGVITFVAGSDPARVRFLVPFLAITEDDIRKAIQIIEDTLIDFKPSI